MNEEKLLTTILGCHVSEKSNDAADKRNQLVFKVATNANKYQIKLAVQKLFNVTVENVTTVVNKPKSKRFKGINGKRKLYKKAYVSLSEGSTIDFDTA